MRKGGVRFRKAGGGGGGGAVRFRPHTKRGGVAVRLRPDTKSGGEGGGVSGASGLIQKAGRWKEGGGGCLAEEGVVPYMKGRGGGLQPPTPPPSPGSASSQLPPEGRAQVNGHP